MLNHLRKVMRSIFLLKNVGRRSLCLIRAVFQYFFDNLMLRIHFIICNLTYMVSFSITEDCSQGYVLTLRMIPNQHTSRALDAQRGCTQPATQQEHGVIDQTNLKIDETDVELVLGRKSSRTSPGKTRQGGARGGSPRPARLPRMPLNLTGKLNEQQEGLRGGN